MAVQTQLNNVNYTFIRAGLPLVIIKANETFLRITARSTDIVRGTVVSYNATSKKWVPFEDETATDGTQIPTGILMETITAAKIAAADVVDVPILVADALIDKGQIVIESSKTLDTIINVPVNYKKTVEECLRMVGIIPEETVAIDGLTV